MRVVKLKQWGEIGEDGEAESVRRRRRLWSESSEEKKVWMVKLKQWGEQSEGGEAEACEDEGEKTCTKQEVED